MLYCVSQNDLFLNYVSSGKFTTTEKFTHSRRNLDSFVILIGVKGTLYICQDEHRYELKPNNFVVLFPGHEHYGYRECEKDLVYYWCHFYQGTPNFKFLNDKEMHQYLFMMQNDMEQNYLSNVYIFPEYGEISSKDRTSLVFHQLLDLSSQKSYSSHMTDCTLSLLSMEITQNFINDSVINLKNITKIHHNVAEIMDWIKINYDLDLSVLSIAEHFNYSSDYLSTTFKKYTGLPLHKYINKAKIEVSKQFLLDTDLSVKEISQKCGFTDEKHFMKLFKQFEDISPTKYRNAFYRKHINKA